MLSHHDRLKKFKAAVNANMKTWLKEYSTDLLGNELKGVVDNMDQQFITAFANIVCPDGVQDGRSFNVGTKVYKYGDKKNAKDYWDENKRVFWYKDAAESKQKERLHKLCNEFAEWITGDAFIPRYVDNCEAPILANGQIVCKTNGNSNQTIQAFKLLVGVKKFMHTLESGLQHTANGGEWKNPFHGASATPEYETEGQSLYQGGWNAQKSFQCYHGIENLETITGQQLKTRISNAKAGIQTICTGAFGVPAKLTAEMIKKAKQLNTREKKALIIKILSGSSYGNWANPRIIGAQSLVKGKIQTATIDESNEADANSLFIKEAGKIEHYGYHGDYFVSKDNKYTLDEVLSQGSVSNRTSRQDELRRLIKEDAKEASAALVKAADAYLTAVDEDTVSLLSSKKSTNPQGVSVIEELYQGVKEKITRIASLNRDNDLKFLEFHSPPTYDQFEVGQPVRTLDPTQDANAADKKYRYGRIYQKYDGSNYTHDKTTGLIGIIYDGQRDKNVSYVPIYLVENVDNQDKTDQMISDYTDSTEFKAGFEVRFTENEQTMIGIVTKTPANKNESVQISYQPLNQYTPGSKRTCHKPAHRLVERNDRNSTHTSDIEKGTAVQADIEGGENIHGEMADKYEHATHSYAKVAVSRFNRTDIYEVPHTKVIVVSDFSKVMDSNSPDIKHLERDTPVVVHTTKGFRNGRVYAKRDSETVDIPDGSGGTTSVDAIRVVWNNDATETPVMVPVKAVHLDLGGNKRKSEPVLPDGRDYALGESVEYYNGQQWKQVRISGYGRDIDTYEIDDDGSKAAAKADKLRQLQGVSSLSNIRPKDIVWCIFRKSGSMQPVQCPKGWTSKKKIWGPDAANKDWKGMMPWKAQVVRILEKGQYRLLFTKTENNGVPSGNDVKTEEHDIPGKDILARRRPKVTPIGRGDREEVLHYNGGGRSQKHHPTTAKHTPTTTHHPTRKPTTKRHATRKHPSASPAKHTRVALGQAGGRRTHRAV